MFNYGAIDRTPTIYQVKAIVEYLDKSPNIKCDFNMMLKMTRKKPNIIEIDINNAHFGETHDFIFEEDMKTIKKVVKTGSWIS